MGSSRNLKAKGQPRQILSSKEFGVISEYSGIEEFNGGGKIAGKPYQLITELVLINPDVHEKTKPGDPLFIRNMEDKLEVMTSNGRLGNVPTHDKNTVISKGLQTGIVIELNDNPKKAIVKLEA